MALILRSREEAHAAGLKRFYTGKPCHKGHDCERYTSTGGCCDCVNWKTPHGTSNKSAANLCFPERAFLFVTPCTRDEMEAALRYVAHMRWHESALQALRDDPALMLQFARAPTETELVAARAVITRDELRRRGK
jgi:hypothetical protein